MNRAIAILIVGVATLGCFRGSAQESCSRIVCQGNAAKRKFLGEQNDLRDSPCVVPTIKSLGCARDVRAIPVLIKYLDYQDPNSGPQSPMPDRRASYPAITALFQIGQAAAPQLVSAIIDGRSELAQHHAAVAYLFVYRDDLAGGIRLLQRQEKIASSELARQRLSTTIQMLKEDCDGRTPKEVRACRTVVAQKK